MELWYIFMHSDGAGLEHDDAFLGDISPSPTVIATLIGRADDADDDHRKKNSPDRSHVVTVRQFRFDGQFLPRLFSTLWLAPFLTSKLIIPITNGLLAH